MSAPDDIGGRNADVLPDHPLRYELANEIHARPFPVVPAPCRAVYLALKPAENAADRDRDADSQHLISLLDRHGAAHPPPGATHWSGRIGKHHLTWESHTEFVSYTVFLDGLSDRPYDPSSFDVFPSDWLAQAPGTRLTSAHIRAEVCGCEEVAKKVDAWFVGESVAVSQVLDCDAVIAGDFRIDPGGHMRFAVFVDAGTDAQRTGRILQRLLEIETYKAMSMLGFARARRLSGELAAIGAELSQLTSDMVDETLADEATLRGLLTITSKIEQLLGQSNFRFGATRAYEAIVAQRINILREERFENRQTFAEFMMRRFDPAMRTAQAAERRLETMASRAMRAAELLRTRVDVARSAQNQALLTSMDRRADAQLRLQKTVEGLSVIAVSYYSVNLLSYLLAPVAELLGVSKVVLTAMITLPVVFAIWRIVRRIRGRIQQD